MTYTALRGQFVVRYPDLPRQGPQPDGDTVKFRPDTPGLVEALPRPSGTAPALNARGVSVRLEAIDALETHFEETHQELTGADAARDALLATLGFTDVIFYPDLPNPVESANADSLPGYVLSNGVDANGRVIGFVYPGTPSFADGAQVFLDEAAADRSVNGQLLAAGSAYPAFYGTLPSSLRRHLAQSSQAARADGRGLWPRSTADPNGRAAVPDLATLKTLVIWPKLFRRLVLYLATGDDRLDGFDAWLRADPVNRDDTIFRLDLGEPANLHDVFRAAANHVQLILWPEDFIIGPDPAPAGGLTGARTYAPGDVAIVAALPDPTGTERGHETVIVINTVRSSIDLTGWQIGDGVGRRTRLSGGLAGGTPLSVALGAGAMLPNTGGSLTLFDGSGAMIDHVNYAAAQVIRGRTIVFGR